MTLVDSYSGIVINQNQKPAASNDWLDITDGQWRYQEVFLPSDYVRGSVAGSQIIPPLSGWQMLVGVDVGSQATATLQWTADYQIFGVGWVTLASGTTTGIHAVADQVWMDLPFDTAVDMDLLKVADRLRFGFKRISGVNKVWYSNPNPLALKGFAKLRAADGMTAIQDSGADISILFRVLSLVADAGVDFLGNSYRSALRSNVSDNTSTVDSATEDSLWVSEPAPSRFAVKSLYYDVRQPTPIVYGTVNRIINPSFEIGTAGWAINAAGTAISRDLVTWSDRGAASLQITNTGGAQVAGGATFTSFSCITGRTYGAACDLNVTSSLSNGVRLKIAWYDLTNTLLSTSLGAFTTGTGIKYINMSAVAPANAITGRLIVETTGTSGSFLFFMDSVIVTEGASIPTYFDGDNVNCRWTGDPHNSTSVQVIQGTIADDQVVIDNVLVDPVTPGIFFSIYYSSEGDRPDNEDDWENKLWTKVPGTYRAVKRESYKLPAPITTKYVKIEFTHLQAQSYNPGDFAKPVAYKKHPKWVLDYFLAQLAAQQQLTNPLAFGRVAVVYDALNLAYNYYLDDLKQEPDLPVEVDPSYTDTVQDFLNQSGDASDVVDSTVLDQINLTLDSYKNLPGVFAKNTTILGNVTQASIPNQQDYSVEASTTPRVDITTLRNPDVVQDNDFPVMYFYLTCRHKYREVIAPFSHDRAYFVSIREIAFTRDNYAVATDNDRYVEPTGDTLNMERNDFQQDDGILTV